MKFTKMQGAGNDFVVIETDGKLRHDWPKLATRMCDRHFGVGADGLLLYLPSRVADFRMRIINKDGSESSTCGNGLRCLVKYFIDTHPESPRDLAVAVETAAGVRRATVHRRGKTTDIQLGMGEPRVGYNGASAILSAADKAGQVAAQMDRVIAVHDQNLLLSLVSVGNPHAVHFCTGSVQAFPLTVLGPEVEQHRLFPDETNFEVAHIVSRTEVEARVWERGVGETLACGSGACAITVAGRLHGYLDKNVDVRLPGGVLTVEWGGSGEVYLSGPSVTVFEGEWPGC